jgi:hypothetical protein
VLPPYPNFIGSGEEIVAQSGAPFVFPLPPSDLLIPNGGVPTTHPPQQEQSDNPLFSELKSVAKKKKPLSPEVLGALEKPLLPQQEQSDNPLFSELKSVVKKKKPLSAEVLGALEKPLSALLSDSPSETQKELETALKQHQGKLPSSETESSDDEPGKWDPTEEDSKNEEGDQETQGAQQGVDVKAPLSPVLPIETQTSSPTEPQEAAIESSQLPPLTIAGEEENTNAPALRTQDPPRIQALLAPPIETRTEQEENADSPAQEPKSLNDHLQVIRGAVVGSPNGDTGTPWDTPQGSYIDTESSDFARAPENRPLEVGHKIEEGREEQARIAPQREAEQQRQTDQERIAQQAEPKRREEEHIRLSAEQKRLQEQHQRVSPPPMTITIPIETEGISREVPPALPPSPFSPASGGEIVLSTGLPPPPPIETRAEREESTHILAPEPQISFIETDSGRLASVPEGRPLEVDHKTEEESEEEATSESREMPAVNYGGVALYPAPAINNRSMNLDRLPAADKENEVSPRIENMHELENTSERSSSRDSRDDVDVKSKKGSRDGSRAQSGEDSYEDWAKTMQNLPPHSSSNSSYTSGGTVGETASEGNRSSTFSGSGGSDYDAKDPRLSDRNIKMSPIKKKDAAHKTKEGPVRQKRKPSSSREEDE